MSKNVIIWHILRLARSDFSKAFDTVPHRNNYGIRGNTLRWLSSFLTKRKQQVVEGATSSPCTVDRESGVPQGTFLGALLFLCHINDLPLSVTSQVRLFTDDRLSYRDIRSLSDQQALQKGLHLLETWASKWVMHFNASKCHHMTITF